MEEWKQVKGFPNFEVSDLGNVRNIKKNKLVPISDGRISLYEPKQRVRCWCVTSLVYSHFVEDKYVVKFYFKDGNKENRSVDNLYTAKERDEKLLKDYADGMSIDDLRKKYNVDYPESIVCRLGGKRKTVSKIKVNTIKDKPEKIEPTDPIILRLREKYRNLKEDNRNNGQDKNEAVRIDDVSNVMPTILSERYLLKQFCYNY